MNDLLNQLSTLPPLEHALTILLVLVSFFSLMFVMISLTPNNDPKSDLKLAFVMLTVFIASTFILYSNTNRVNTNNLEDAEKILAAEFYTLNAKKCKNKMKMETLVFKSTDEQYSEFKLISEQYKEEFQTITKQFLTETPREFLRLNNFEVVEQ